MDVNKEALAQGFLWSTEACREHGRFKERCSECAKDEHIRQLEAANALLRSEKGVYEESSRRWRALAEYAYHRSSEALMTSPQKPREAREARDNALCAINKKLGGAMR